MVPALAVSNLDNCIGDLGRRFIAERANIVGIKPTVGLTSRAGIIPGSSHQDTVGVFGRNVADAVRGLDAIYGVDERDKSTSEQIGKTPQSGK